jgi:hypothetical protein
MHLFMAIVVILYSCPNHGPNNVILHITHITLITQIIPINHTFNDIHLCAQCAHLFKLTPLLSTHVQGRLHALDLA